MWWWYRRDVNNYGQKNGDITGDFLVIVNMAGYITHDGSMVRLYINANMTGGFCWWDPWHTIYSTMDPMGYILIYHFNHIYIYII